MLKRIKTGIPGLDSITGGGLIKNSVNLLCGGTGTGKTIFSLQYILNGAKQYNERGFYISFEETEDDLKSDIEGLGIPSRAVEDDPKIKNKLKSVVESKGLSFKEVSKGVEFFADTKFAYIPVYGITNFDTFLKREL